MIGDEIIYAETNVLCEMIQRLSVFRCYCCRDMELKFVLQAFFWLFQTIPAH